MRVASVDIGTNTVRLLLADIKRRDGVLRVGNAERHEVITRLGEGLDSSGKLADDAMGRALAGLSYYTELISGFAAEHCAAVATEATRSAANGAEFIDRTTGVLGFRPRILDGEEEARLTFAGARSALNAAGPAWVIDVGGGSTEFVVGTDHPEYAVSVGIGSVRLTERIDSVPLESAAAMRAHVDALFANVAGEQSATRVLGSGGTFVTLAAVHLGHSVEDQGTSAAVTLSVEEVTATVDRLLGMTVAEIAALPGVVPGRAPVLPAGAICAERAVLRVGAGEVTVSVSDILDGVALRAAAGSW